MAGYSPAVWMAYTTGSAVAGSPVSKLAPVGAARVSWQYGGSGSFTGYTIYEGVVAQMRVFVYDQATRLLVGSAFSDRSGYYSISGLDPTRYFAIACWDITGKYNPQVYYNQRTNA